MGTTNIRIHVDARVCSAQQTYGLGRKVLRKCVSVQNTESRLRGVEWVSITAYYVRRFVLQQYRCRRMMNKRIYMLFICKLSD